MSEINRQHQKTRPLHILFVIENYYPHIGGGEIVFQILAENLVRRGHRVSIVTHRPKDTPKFQRLGGVEVWRIPCFESRYWFTFLSLPKVFKLARSADVIHTTTYNGAFPAWVASKLIGRPAVITVHEILGAHWKSFEISPLAAQMFRGLEKMVVSLPFDQYIGVSESTRSQLIHEGKRPEKVRRIYNGVDYQFWNREQYPVDRHRPNSLPESLARILKKHPLDQRYVFLFFGRPGVTKGLEVLVRAIPKVIKKHPNARLLAVVSNDPNVRERHQQICQLIKEIGVEEQVIMSPSVPRSDLPFFITYSDCVVVPSLTEGFGFTAAESCALGKPVVASNTTSLPEVVSGKYNLAAPGDPDALAQAMEKMIEGEFETRPLKQFLIPEQIDQYEAVYRELI